ncbi:SAM-dependent methyltransferase [Thermomonospora umbrina]|uniref:S-adenosyl methyltransferase n=1 Tax=Thermomonospora umbrina TaxID=111806 RepID=A0A3D9SIR6_9ACTN|nr:SAM-dependent methyltransferase [Thermomonospora umbrina]REE95792.1 S-adenosyl methyltransferase [Thermomonospora umbrina]
MAPPAVRRDRARLSGGAPEFDLSRPNAARICNVLLDGKDNFESDRSAAHDLLHWAPEMRALAKAGRDFLGRAVRHLTDGPEIGQFLDLGTGMPIHCNVHDMAAQSHPSPRVVYVDNDTVAVTHARALLDNGTTTVAIEGDLRDPTRILEDPQVAAILDFERPVAVLMTSVLHFVADADRPGESVRTFLEALAPGSALVISHACRDHAAPEALAGVEAVYEATTTPLTARTRDEIAALFDGWELGPRGPVDIAYWPLSTERRPRPAMTLYGGVAHLRPWAARS